MNAVIQEQVLTYRGPTREAELAAARARSLGMLVDLSPVDGDPGRSVFTATLGAPIRWVELLALVEVLAHTTDPYAHGGRGAFCLLESRPVENMFAIA